MAKRDFLIRPATESDIPGLLRCLRNAFAPYEAEYTRRAFLDTVLTERTARVRLASMRVLVATTGSGELIGTIAWALESESVGHLRGMAVLPPWMGSRVAQSLLDRAMAELAMVGCERVTLDTTRPLSRAIRFYERNGFRPSGQVSDFFGMDLIERVRSLPAR